MMLAKGGVCGALLTYLSKAFDCLPRDFLLAKLHAYGLDYQSLKYYQVILVTENKEFV